ncbi:hypothetical protein B9Z19DRAFT_1061812 [Tuber borchii]|uniref:Uncharacterized protein n=1 Tax=Tuber borchii TaxID=42251 RepID=A0A2T7A401_TUBBO|nr:hypothetical protein B9Z19DRAFT_1061812 [Tuber borchii]
MARMKSLFDHIIKRLRGSSMRSTLSTGSPPKAPPSRSSTSTHPLTLQRRSYSFNMHRAVVSLVAAYIELAVGLARAVRSDTSHTREPISGCTRFKIRLRRRNPATNRPEQTHTSTSTPIGGEDHTSERLLTAENMEGDLDMTVREDGLDTRDRPLIDRVYEEWEKDEEDQDVDFIDQCDEEKIYEEEEEEEEEEETDKNGNTDNGDDYHNDGEREHSSDSLIWSENGAITMIGADEISGSSLGSASRNLDRSDSAPSTGGLYGDIAENRFSASTQEIGERLLGLAMTPKDFFISPEDQQDRMEYIITKRKRLFASNARLIIDLETPARKDAEEHGIDLEEMDRIDREMDMQALLNLTWQQFPCPMAKGSENKELLLPLFLLPSSPSFPSSLA